MRIILFTALMLITNFAFAKEKFQIGDAAPNVIAKTQAGVDLDFSQVYAKNKYVVIYFYPKAKTPGCTAQSCSLQDSYAILKSKGVEVLGVSVDTAEEQLDFKNSNKLDFTLIADVDKKVINAFGVETFLGLAKRQAFLIQNGKIIWMDRSASTKEQAQDILKVLETQK